LKNYASKKEKGDPEDEPLKKTGPLSINET